MIDITPSSHPLAESQGTASATTAFCSRSVPRGATFGIPTREYHIPVVTTNHEGLTQNSTLFLDLDRWLMAYSDDPLEGWRQEDVENTSSGPATADIYGKMHYHVRNVLGSFIRRISCTPVSLSLFHMDACALPGHLQKASFSRIEVRTYLNHDPLFHIPFSQALFTGLEYIRRSLRWDTPHSCFDGPLSRGASGQSARDTDHIFHD